MEVHYGDGDTLYQEVTPTTIDKGVYYGTVPMPHRDYDFHLDNSQVLVFALGEDGPWYTANDFMVRTQIVPRYNDDPLLGG